MGYFDGLTASSFKTDEKGNTIFYPWGIFGKGYILPEDRKDSLRQTIKRHMMIFVPLAILCSIFFKIWIAFLLIPLYFFGYGIWVNRQTNGLEVSSDKLTLSDARTSSARSHNMATLWLLEIASLLFVFLGTFNLIISPKNWFVSTCSIIFFGFGAIIFWKMIKTKKEQAK